MRDITYKAVKAFMTGQNFRLKNTLVTFDCIELFGNPIIKRIMTEGDPQYQTGWEISMCGWGSPTTRERLNGFINCINGDLGFSQRKGRQYFVGIEISTDAIIRLDKSGNVTEIINND